MPLSLVADPDRCRCRQPLPLLAASGTGTGTGTGTGIGIESVGRGTGQSCYPLAMAETVTPDSIRAAAEAFAANDPYAKAGLFEDVSLQEWKKVVG